MHEIRVNIDTIFGFHPPTVIIQENGKTLLDMPADEFISWVKLARRRQEGNNEGDVPSPDGNKPSDSLPGAGS